MTRILGEYTTLAGEPRRLVAVHRTGPPGWCLLDVSARVDAPSNDFQIVRRLGDPSTFARVAEHWISRARTSPLGANSFRWRITSEARRGTLAIQTTVDIYRDDDGMRRLVVVSDPTDSECTHLVDVAVAADHASARLVAADVNGQENDFAAVHIEQVLAQSAAVRARHAGWEAAQHSRCSDPPEAAVSGAC